MLQISLGGNVNMSGATPPSGNTPLWTDDGTSTQYANRPLYSKCQFTRSNMHNNGSLPWGLADTSGLFVCSISYLIFTICSNNTCFLRCRRSHKWSDPSSFFDCLCFPQFLVSTGKPSCRVPIWRWDIASHGCILLSNIQNISSIPLSPTMTDASGASGSGVTSGSPTVGAKRKGVDGDDSSPETEVCASQRVRYP